MQSTGQGGAQYSNHEIPTTQTRRDEGNQCPYNQCVEIISEVVERKSSGLSNDEIWGQALQKVIPRRKIKT